eukprot:g2430.t1
MEAPAATCTEEERTFAEEVPSVCRVHIRQEILSADYEDDAAQKASPAVALRLRALSPPEVSFDGAGGGPELLLQGLSLVPHVEVSILITSVRLGRGGGPSRYSLQTFRTPYEGVVDERLDFFGFYQAGRAEVSGTLQGSHMLEPTGWLRTLPPRAAEKGFITLNLVFSMDLFAGDVLIVTCQGLGPSAAICRSAYVLFSDSLVMERLTFVLTGEAMPVLASNQGEHELHIALDTGGNASNGSALVAAQFARLHFQAIPTAEANTWKVDSWSGSTLSNTNDGTFPGFQPVLPLFVELVPTRAPPDARIAVNLKVTAAASSNQLRLVAPEGFRFPSLCGDLCASFGEFFEDTARAMATLSSSSSLLGESLTFQVLTPLRTPQVVTWLVRAYGPTGQLDGWGVAAGAGVAEHEMNLRIIEVQGPSEVQISCENSLKPLNLPEASCAAEGLGQLRLELGSSLQSGTYAFSVHGDLPTVTPPQNDFSMIIRQVPTEQVADAAFGVPGWPLGELETSQPLLAWSTAGVGEVSSVTISFFMRNVTGALRALLINLPSGFQHRVRGSNEFKVSNPKLPLLKGASDWLEVSQLDRIVVRLEPEDWDGAMYCGSCGLSGQLHVHVSGGPAACRAAARGEFLAAELLFLTQLRPSHG